MSQGIFTRRLRFKWVKGQVTTTPDAGFVACGPDTLFCAEVSSLDMLAEFFYRAKTALFSTSASSKITTQFDDSGGPVFSYLFSNGAALPLHLWERDAYPAEGPFDYYSEDYFAENKRGYFLSYTDPAAIPLDLENRFGEGYSFYPQVSVDGYIVNTSPELITAHDTLGFESNMWKSFSTDSAVTTAFSFSSQTLLYGGPMHCLRVVSSFDGYTAVGGHIASLKVYPFVAWVDDSLSGNPIAPGNRWFIKLLFKAETYGGNLAGNGEDVSPPLSPSDLIASFGEGYLFNNNPALPAAPTLSLTLKLATGDIVIPLLSFFEAGYGANSICAGNLDLEVIEWWPYATDLNAFGRVWESETGVKIPEGAGFANADDPDEALSIYTFF